MSIKKKILLGVTPIFVLAVVLFVGLRMAPAATTIKNNEVATTTPGGGSSITLKGNQQNVTVTSSTYKSEFEFNAIAPHWKEQNGGDKARTVSVRASVNGHKWSDWVAVEVMPPQKDGAPHADELFPEAPIFITGKYFQYKVALSRNGGKAPVVEDLKVAYFDSRESKVSMLMKAVKSFLSPVAVAANAQPNVISRAAWGSPDPTGLAFRGTDRYWDPAYAPTKQIFIHHTVDSNYESQSDGAALVRAIWQYHTNTLGWGDIGYNYLVDESGKIYEGRAGGSNIVGGHVYGYNTGSMGVALLGCFQPNDATCNSLNGGNTAYPSSAMQTSLFSLLSWKSTEYEIDPSAQQVFCKQDTSGCLLLYTISGHRDAYPTSCPGDLAETLLTYIRSQTSGLKVAGYAYSAKQISFPSVNLGDSTEKSVTLSYKNTGSTTWSQGGTGHIVLGTANPSDHASAFQGSDWLSSNRAAYLNETSVAPGATGTFTFKIKNPAGYTGDWHEYFRLVAEGVADFGGFSGLPVVTRQMSSEYAGESPYPQLFPGQTTTSYLSYKNTGNVSWYDDTSIGTAPAGSAPMRLATSHPINRPSGFGGTWGGDQNRASGAFAAVYQSDGSTLAPDQHVAQPGQIVKFNFEVSIGANLAPGVYREYFQPIMEGLSTMNDPGTFLDVTVREPIYTSEFSWQSAYPSMQQGQGADASMRYKNSGNQAWYDDASLGSAAVGTKPVHLATSNGINRRSALGGLWGGDQNRAAYRFGKVYEGDGTTLATSQHIAQPGQIVQFDFRFKADYGLGSGMYHEYFQPIVEGGSNMTDQGTFLDVAVRQGTYLSEFYSQSPYLTLIRPGSGTATTPAYFMYKNIGNATWYDATSTPIGSRPSVLATTDPINRSSALADTATWGNPIDRNRATYKFAGVYEADGTTLAADQHVAQPGQIAKFSFDFAAISTTTLGTYREYFQEIIEGGPTMNDVGTFLDVKVQ